MFLANHFADPLAVGTFVSPGVENEEVAASDLAVAEYQDATNFNVGLDGSGRTTRIEIEAARPTLQ